ncbi:UDP-N-acetylmuramate dehydrogenase [Pseudomonadota bacterium]|nr:UDP-N-acetylmuramate dehydrogenase [Pseudomonadota bacterium]
MKQFKKIHNALNIQSYADDLIQITSKSEVNELLNLINDNRSLLVIGEGTNLVLPENISFSVVQPKINFIEQINEHEVKVGSGINWTTLVKYCLQHNMFGFENLIDIPGSVGAAPVQNIGAFGVEISKFIKAVDCVDLVNGDQITLSQQQCEFSYRSSIFQKKRYLITAVHFHFPSTHKLICHYDSIQALMKKKGMISEDLSPIILSELVSEIRSSNLPNPSIIPNVGSFFKNPIIKKADLSLKNFKESDLIIWDVGDEKIKLGAGRMIELIKSRFQYNINVDVYQKHALVIVNKNNAKQEDVLKFVDEIKSLIEEEFSITLEVEPEIIYS